MNKQDGSDHKVSIKEFAEYTGVKQSVLRYYDEIGLFDPAERGENNYRYYALSQIQTIKLIETLRGLNMPLHKIKEIMNFRTPETMVDILSQYEAQLTIDLRALQESFALIHTLRSLIQSGAVLDENEIGISFWEEQRVSLGPLSDFKPGESYHRVYSNYYRHARIHRVNLSYPIGGYFDTFEEFLANPSQPKRFFSLDPNGIDVCPAGNYLSGYTRGDYGVLNNLPQSLDNYIRNRHLKVIGPVYQIYLLSEVCIENPEQYLARVNVRLA